MVSKKISYFQMKAMVEVMIMNIFENELTAGGWKMDEFLETYALEISSKLEEETFDISMSAPPLLQ